MIFPKDTNILVCGKFQRVVYEPFGASALPTQN